MNKYNNFTVEETNLLSIYMTGSKEGLVVAMNAALPFMEGEIPSRSASSCRRFVSFAAGVSNRNWSTDIW